MADTDSDFTFKKNGWYAVSIDGTPISGFEYELSNKSSRKVIYKISATEPLSSDRSGPVLDVGGAGKAVIIGELDNQCWVRCDGSDGIVAIQR